MPFDWHCMKLIPQCISETADCDFKTRGVFVRLMNQRCVQQPNRCCSPPVSREMPMVSCTGHLAPWCLSLFIVRGFPITRAGRGHFLSTLSTERCVHNTWRCHRAREAESGPCSAWSCLDSWTEARGEKSERLSKSPWKESGHQVFGCWYIGFSKDCGLWVLCWYTELSKLWRFILLLCVASERKDVKKLPFPTKKSWNQFFFSWLLRKSQPLPAPSPQLYSVAEAAGTHCKVRRDILTSYFLSYDIEGSCINAGKMEQWTKNVRQTEWKHQLFNRGVLTWEYGSSFT